MTAPGCEDALVRATGHVLVYWVLNGVACRYAATASGIKAVKSTGNVGKRLAGCNPEDICAMFDMHMGVAHAECFELYGQAQGSTNVDWGGQPPTFSTKVEKALGVESYYISVHFNQRRYSLITMSVRGVSKAFPNVHFAVPLTKVQRGQLEVAAKRLVSAQAYVPPLIQPFINAERV